MEYRELIKEIRRLIKPKDRFYQGFSKLCLVGQRPTEMRCHVYGLKKVIDEKSTVLDLGSNIGCMSLHIAEVAKEVHGVERYSNLVQVADLIKEFLGIENCFFHCMNVLNFKPLYEFDVILSLSFHHWRRETFERFAKEVFKEMLRKGGHLLFESHGPKSRRLFEEYADYLRVIGFEERWGGVCQCPSPYEKKPNPHRKFYMFQLMNK